MSQLLAPSVGIFTPAVAEGQLVSAGQAIGTIEVLGVHRTLLVPDGVSGRVSQRAGGRRLRVPVQHGDALLTVLVASFSDSSNAGLEGISETEAALAFVAPMSGRFYGRPSPTEAPFVAVGDTVQRGQTVGLLEVMKTFNRLVYEGESLPETAKVERVVPNDGDDVVRGEAILMLGLPEEE